MNLREAKDKEKREKIVGEFTQKKFSAINTELTDEEVRKNIENFIGVVKIPLGVAGPIQVNEKKYLLPLATTEGALVASVSRGCKNLRVNAEVVSDGMTRAPVFRVKDLNHAKKVVEWVKNNFNEIKQIGEEGSRHLKINSVQHWIIGKNLFLRFVCGTGDAMGMNMVTIGVTKASSLIQEKTGAKLISVSGNVCTDKKSSSLNFVEGRGKSVVAEAVLSREHVEKVLKTTPEAMQEVCYRKNLVGTGLTGSQGFNAHFANVVAAMFIALGQDPAHVVDASQGYSLFEVCDEGLHCSVMIPSLNVGTVGGGTRLPSQKECLSILGIGNARELAEVIAGAVLAGEISLMAAHSSNDTAKAHQELGR